MSELKSALFYSIVTQHSIKIISFVSIAILARLLSPAEIGVFAVASSIAFLAIELRALGVGQYLVRETDINDSKIRSATGLMIAVSWGLAALIILSATTVADFYNEKALATIFWILSGTFILAPFSSVPASLLTRNMLFKKLFVVKLSSSIMRSGSSIAFVTLGYSYYGLAMGTLCGALIEFLVLNYFRPKNTPWLPSFSGMRNMIRFGLFTSSGNVLQRFAQSIPDLVLGRMSTMSDVGLFSRGLGLVTFLNEIIVQAVRPVVLPHLSAVNRAGESVGKAYLNAIVLQSAFSWPIFATVNLAAYPMIRALFGDQWDIAVPIASTLAIWAILQSVHVFSAQALMAVKNEKLMFIKELLIFIARLAAIIGAAPYGLSAVSWAMVLTGAFELAINTCVVHKALKIKISQMITAFIPSALVATACWLSLYLLSINIDFKSGNPWFILILIGSLMLVIWLLALRITKHAAWQIITQIIHKITPKIRG